MSKLLSLRSESSLLGPPRGTRRAPAGGGHRTRRYLGLRRRLGRVQSHDIITTLAEPVDGDTFSRGTAAIRSRRCAPPWAGNGWPAIGGLVALGRADATVTLLAGFSVREALRSNDWQRDAAADGVPSWRPRPAGRSAGGDWSLRPGCGPGRGHDWHSTPCTSPPTAPDTSCMQAPATRSPNTANAYARSTGSWGVGPAPPTTELAAQHGQQGRAPEPRRHRHHHGQLVGRGGSWRSLAAGYRLNHSQRSRGCGGEVGPGKTQLARETSRAAGAGWVVSGARPRWQAPPAYGVLAQLLPGTPWSGDDIPEDSLEPRPPGCCLNSAAARDGARQTRRPPALARRRRPAADSPSATPAPRGSCSWTTCIVAVPSSPWDRPRAPALRPSRESRRPPRRPRSRARPGGR